MSKNFYWILICILWLVGVVEDSLAEISNSNITQKSLMEEKIDDQLLIQQWQDYVLANAIVANYLNILMVFASRSDFSLVSTPNHCARYINNPDSFHQTISQLADNTRRALSNIYGDFNRANIGLERLSIHLKTTLLLIKIGSNDSINTNLPRLLQKSENITNSSFILLKNPTTRIESVKDLLTELNSLISLVTSDTMIPLQIEDVQTQWTLLTDLFTHLAMSAEKVIHSFLLQFNWLIEQFDRINIDDHRDLIINLIKPNAIEIDRTTDLLSIISKTYVDISNEYSNIKMSTNTHLILLPTEQERKEAIKQHRYELQPEAVKIARSALKRHDEFLQRNENRESVYEKFLNAMTENDLEVLLSLD